MPWKLPPSNGAIDLSSFAATEWPYRPKIKMHCH